MNKVSLIGNLTKDIELRKIPSGKSVGNGSIATNKSWTDAQGNKQKSTQFHNFVVWGKTAEVLAQYTKKGDQIYLEGELQHSEYTGQDGIKRYRTDVLVSGFEFLRNGDRKANSAGNAPAGEEDWERIAREEEAGGGQEEEIRVENIPF